ncbi:MAG: hypothetical protein ACOYIK_04500, partial [Coriobacteriales bacterium]
FAIGAVLINRTKTFSREDMNKDSKKGKKRLKKNKQRALPDASKTSAAVLNEILPTIEPKNSERREHGIGVGNPENPRETPLD